MLNKGGHIIEILISSTKWDGRDFVRNSAWFFFFIRKCNVSSVSLKDNLGNNFDVEKKRWENYT